MEVLRNFTKVKRDIYRRGFGKKGGKVVPQARKALQVRSNLFWFYLSIIDSKNLFLHLSYDSIKT